MRCCSRVLRESFHCGFLEICFVVIYFRVYTRSVKDDASVAATPPPKLVPETAQARRGSTSRSASMKKANADETATELSEAQAQIAALTEEVKTLKEQVGSISC